MYLTSRLGFGTWQFGGPNWVNGKPTGWGAVNVVEATEAIQTALRQGVTFFDTADSYGRGQAEELLGNALRSATLPDQHNVVICTKWGNRFDADGQPVQDFSAHYVVEAVEASLRRLRRDTLDVLLLHSPPDNFDWAAYDATTLEELKKQGKIRAYGVSAKSVYGARRVMDAGFGSVLEILYNALDRRAEDVLFNHSAAGAPAATTYQFIARVPLASGFLNGRYLTETPRFATDEYRYFLPERDRDWLLSSARALAFLDELPGGLATSALRFCLSHPAVSVVIPGMRSPAQVLNNVVAERLGPLPPDVLARIRAAVPDVPEHWKPKR